MRARGKIFINYSSLYKIILSRIGKGAGCQLGMGVGAGGYVGETGTLVCVCGLGINISFITFTATLLHFECASICIMDMVMVVDEG